MLTYNYDFDIAALVIFFVVYLFYRKKKHIKDRQHYSFCTLVYSAFFTTVWDIISATMIGQKQFGLPLVIVTTFYYMNLQGTVFSFVMYLVDNLVMKEKYTRRLKLCLFVPIFVMLLLILTNPFTSLIFRVDANGYSAGPLQILCYIIALFYVSGAGYYLVTNWKVYNQKLRLMVCNVAVVNIAPVIVQIIFPEYLLMCFGFAISSLLLLMAVQDHESILNPETGMANKSYLAEVVNRMIYNKYDFSAIMIRVADYDLITTTYGVYSAEEVMKEMAIFIQSHVDIGRAFQVSGNCFVLIPKDENIEELEQLLYQRLSRNWNVNGTEIVCSIFVTHVDYPNRVHTLDDFDAHLTYFQKMHRMRFGIVAPEELEVKDKIRQRQVERAIRQGLEEHLFTVYYQPICTTQDRKFVSAEALVRLTDPELGPISPAEFIPISEKNGTIIQIGYYVLEEVCKFIASHDMEALGIEYIEMNLSAVQCLQRDFMETVEEVMQRYRVDSKYICFEITETASNCAPAIFTENLDALIRRGHILALDDFGTGYGNLQRMVTSSFGLIKFDKDMIQQTCSEERLQFAFTRMQSMFHSMGSKVVAEGVETKEQYEFLKASGCDYIQGYYFSRPIPEKEYLAFLEQHK